MDIYDWMMKDGIRWWHFWNPGSGFLGGLIAGIVVFVPPAVFLLMFVD